MAVVAVEAGADVFVADSPAIEVADDETNRYFDELSHDLVEDGHVLGAVIDTPSGICAVRARRGVLVSTGRHDLGAAVPYGIREHATLQVSVVRQAQAGSDALNF